MFILLSHLINVLSNVYGQVGPIISREVVCKLEKESRSFDLSANHVSRQSCLWDFCEHKSNIADFREKSFEKWKNQCSSITAWEGAAVVELDSIGLETFDFGWNRTLKKYQPQVSYLGMMQNVYHALSASLCDPLLLTSPIQFWGIHSRSKDIILLNPPNDI